MPDSPAGAVLLAAALALPAVASAADFDGVEVARVVWDITTGDEHVFEDRLELIRETAAGLEKRGIKPEFVLAIHGPAAKFVAKSLDDTKYEKDHVAKLDAIQASMNDLRNEGMKIEACAIAMKRGKIEKDNVKPFAVIENNVWENITVLQNKGYAYMPVF